MICDKIENLTLYKGFEPRFEMIAAYLAANDLSSVETGRYELGDGVFVNVSEYEPNPAPSGWEAHRKYADLQLILAGDERMDWAPVSEGQKSCGYHEDVDYEGFEECGGNFAPITAYTGTFAYFAPGDAHRPGLFNKAEKVRKAVFKIPV